MKNLLDYFDGQPKEVKIAVIILLGVAGLAILGSFIFAGSDYSGFGDWLLSIFGS